MYVSEDLLRSVIATLTLAAFTTFTVTLFYSILG
jgi:hypothetical protein